MSSMSYRDDLPMDTPPCYSTGGHTVLQDGWKTNCDVQQQKMMASCHCHNCSHQSHSSAPSTTWFMDSPCQLCMTGRAFSFHQARTTKLVLTSLNSSLSAVIITAQLFVGRGSFSGGSVANHIQHFVLPFPSLLHFGFGVFLDCNNE